MFDDPIVEDIRRARREHASKFDNDLTAIAADLRRLEQESGRRHVNFSPRMLEKQASETHRARP